MPRDQVSENELATRSFHSLPRRPVGHERLLILADFLDALPSGREFAMGVFAEEVEDGQPKCGTSACAAGWAASIPSFRREGYRLAQGLGGWVSPAFDGLLGFDALKAFFDMTEYESEKAFDSVDPDTQAVQPDDPKATALRIRALVQNASKATTEA